MDKSIDVLGGFAAVAQSISEEATGGDDHIEFRENDVIDGEEVDEIVDPLEKEDPIVDPEEDEIIDPEEDEVIETDEDDDDKGEIDDEVSDLTFGDAEPELATLVQERLSEALGLEVEEDSKLESLDEVVEYMRAVVEENSQPDYASEDLKKMDEYVRNGGDVRNYLSEAYGEIDYDKIDLTKEANQKSVVQEHLKTKGYSDARINRMITRYEDAGTLEEEAEDALEMTKEYRSDMSEKLLEDQKVQKAAIIERQQKYMADVEHNIDDINDVRGIPISAKDKKELMKYIFQPGSDGKTQYQKDYLKSNKNLIESAYFTMKGDNLIDKVKRKATSDAARNLKKKLAEKGKRTKDQSTGRGDSSVSTIWGIASSQLRQPK